MIIENEDEYQKWLIRVQQNGLALEYVPEALRTEALCLEAVQQDGRALQYVPESLRTEAICLEAVQETGYALEYVPDVLKTEALCLAAVKQDGRALQYVPKALITEALCFAAVQKNGHAFQFVPNALKTEVLSLVAVQQKSYALGHVPNALKTEVICLAAVQQNGLALEFVIRPTNQLAADADQLASWNRILMQVIKTDSFSKEHLQVQLISPLVKQADTVTQLPAPVVDEIATLIEHCERLGVEVEPIKDLYCEKQRLAKPQSKHKKSVSPEHTL